MAVALPMTDGAPGGPESRRDVSKVINGPGMLEPGQNPRSPPGCMAATSLDKGCLPRGPLHKVVSTVLREVTQAFPQRNPPP